MASIGVQIVNSLTGRKKKGKRRSDAKCTPAVTTLKILDKIILIII